MAERFVSELTSALTTEHCSEFEKQGYTVLERGLSSDLAHQLQEAVSASHSQNLMSPNQVQFLHGARPITVTKPHIFEFDMHSPKRALGHPFFLEIFEQQLGALVEVLNARLQSLDLVVGCNAGKPQHSFTTIKLQVNFGGAFPWHYDNPGRPNNRQLTMAVYLTPNWSDGCGGELELWPFMEDAPIPVPPTLGTIVLFRSDLILHRVRRFVGNTNCPARYCFTIWFDSAEVNRDEDVSLRAKHLQLSFLPQLKLSPLQRSLSRILYDAEYRAALVECFGTDSLSAQVSLAAHEAHIKPLQRSASVMEFVDVLSKLRRKSE